MMTRAELTCRYKELCNACGLDETSDDAFRMILEPAAKVELVEHVALSLPELKVFARENADVTPETDRIAFLIGADGMTIDEYSELKEIVIDGTERSMMAISTDCEHPGFKIIIFNCWRD